MKVIVVSHGSFSKGIVESVQMLAGEQENFVAHTLDPQETVADLTERLEAELDHTPEGEEVIFLTDLFHGSPFNAVVSLMKNHTFSHITGVNVPFVLALILGRNAGGCAKEVCEAALREAAGSIMDVNRLFDAEHNEEEDTE